MGTKKVGAPKLEQQKYRLELRGGAMGEQQAKEILDAFDYVAIKLAFRLIPLCANKNCKSKVDRKDQSLCNKCEAYCRRRNNLTDIFADMNFVDGVELD